MGVDMVSIVPTHWEGSVIHRDSIVPLFQLIVTEYMITNQYQVVIGVSYFANVCLVSCIISY